MWVLMLLSCQSKKKAIQSYKENSKEVIKSDTNVVISNDKVERNKQIESVKIDKKDEKITGNVEINATTDEKTPFTYHNIINGDTLQVISVVGNSTIKINSTYDKKQKVETENKVKETLNIIAEVSRKAVSQENIKETTKDIKSAAKDIKSNSFTFGAWFTYLLCFIIVACLVWLFYYLGGKFNIIGRLKKLKNKNGDINS